MSISRAKGLILSFVFCSLWVQYFSEW